MPVRPEYIFRIAVAYVRTQVDNDEITADDAANKAWKDAYKTFKPRIRNHLKLQQRGRCAFCRCIVNIGGSYPNLEHLIPKTSYPQFVTYPANLVYCCWLCNKGKKATNTISKPVANKADQVFPLTSDDYIIVNPYVDDYEAYIDFIDDVLIVNGNDHSEKGLNTIRFYNLTRPELAEERAREFKLNQNNLHHNLLQRLTDSTAPPEVLPQIQAIIHQMPTWTIN